MIEANHQNQTSMVPKKNRHDFDFILKSRYSEARKFRTNTKKYHQGRRIELVFSFDYPLNLPFFSFDYPSKMAPNNTNLVEITNILSDSPLCIPLL